MAHFIPRANVLDRDDKYYLELSQRIKLKKETQPPILLITVLSIIVIGILGFLVIDNFVGNIQLSPDEYGKNSFIEKYIEISYKINNMPFEIANKISRAIR